MCDQEKYKKIKKIQEKIHVYLEDAMETLAEKDGLDYFNIEISNHNGNLQFDYKTRVREKAY